MKAKLTVLAIFAVAGCSRGPVPAQQPAPVPVPASAVEDESAVARRLADSVRADTDRKSVV